MASTLDIARCEHHVFNYNIKFIWVSNSQPYPLSSSSLSPEKPRRGSLASGTTFSSLTYILLSPTFSFLRGIL